jgi:peptide/nickel transport system substrate-binding protein
VGTGPFVFKEWVKGDHVTVTANPKWWRTGYPLVATVIFKTIPEASTRVAALKRGEIDLATRLSADDVKGMKGDTNIQTVQYLADRVYYVAFNNLSTGKGTPIEKPQVRLAMNYAVDKQAIIDSIFGGSGTVAAGLVGPADLGYEGSKPFPYDVAKAKQLLADAGYPNGFSMAMACPSNAFLHINDVCQAVVGFYDKVGIKIDLQFMEPNAFWDLQTKKQTPPLYIDSWSCAYGEAFNRFQGALGKGASYAQWYDDKFDTLTKQIVSTVDVAKRAALYQQMQQLTQTDPPFVYLYYPDSFEATRSRVVGYKPYASEEYYLWGVSLSDAK